MNYEIITQNKMIFVGFKQHFSGHPYDDDRLDQENEFFCSTRGLQWLLIGASSDPESDYCIITNIDESGYDFYIAYKLERVNMTVLFNKDASGISANELGLEILKIDKSKYIHCQTNEMKFPVNEYIGMRKRLIGELEGKVTLRSAPEIAVYHWRDKSAPSFPANRYIELFLPIA